VTRHLRIGWILAEGADKELGETCWHESYFSFGVPAGRAGPATANGRSLPIAKE
jgi:hypothetical protein